MASTMARPAAGPSRMAIAAARFSSTTGDGSARASTSYSPTICGQSVASAVAASACTAAIAACNVYGPNRRDEMRALDQRDALCDQRTIPQTSILIGEQHQLSVRRRPGGAPRFVQQHQREQADGFRLGQELHQQASQSNRFCREVAARERRTGRRGIPFIEDQIDDVQDGVEPRGQLLARGHLIRDAGVANLRLRPDDALSDGWRVHEKRPPNFLRRQRAHFAERQRDLRVQRQRGMAAREDQPQPIVFEGVVGFVGFGRRS